MRLPFLHNVRRGLATNSSSSHSLVYSGGGTTQTPHYATTPEERAEVLRDARGIDPEFGWDGDDVSTLGEKLMYALTDRIGTWGEFTPEMLAEARAKYGHLFPEFEGEDADDIWLKAAAGYVDHQSRGTSANIELLRDPHVHIDIDNDNH